MSEREREKTQLKPSRMRADGQKKKERKNCEKKDRVGVWRRGERGIWWV